MRRREGSLASSVRCEDDIMTDQNVPSYSDHLHLAHHRPEKRSLFSQLGEWLCQAGPQDPLSITGKYHLRELEPTLILLISDPALRTCERSSPVISLPVPGDLQYRLQYTTVNNRGQ